MEINQTIELPTGTVVFQGEVTDEEFDFIVKLGLIQLYLRGDLETTVVTNDGTIVSDVPEQLQ